MTWWLCCKFRWATGCYRRLFLRNFDCKGVKSCLEGLCAEITFNELHCDQIALIDPLQQHHSTLALKGGQNKASTGSHSLKEAGGIDRCAHNGTAPSLVPREDTRWDNRARTRRLPLQRPINKCCRRLCAALENDMRETKHWKVAHNRTGAQQWVFSPPFCLTIKRMAMETESKPMRWPVGLGNYISCAIKHTHTKGERSQSFLHTATPQLKYAHCVKSLIMFVNNILWTMLFICEISIGRIRKCFTIQKK